MLGIIGLASLEKNSASLQNQCDGIASSSTSVGIAQRRNFSVLCLALLQYQLNRHQYKYLTSLSLMIP